MDYTDHRSGRTGGGDGGGSLPFTLFALTHAGCDDELSETRLDEDTVACWCLRCDDARVFGRP